MEQETVMITKKRIPVQKCVYTIPVESRPEQKNLVMWVRLGDLPDDLKLDPNARRADVDSRVAKQIRETLRTAPDSFWKLNSGMQMTARDVEVKDGRTVILDLDDPEDDAEVADGVINGGHTYECIKVEKGALQKEATKSGDQGPFEAFNNATVRVEVLTGLGRHELADISRARNTGEAVKKYSLQNLKKLYEPIKKELGAKECERIGFCENDVDLIPGKTYQVLDLIRLMSLFNNRLYPSGQDKHPVVCYTAAGRLVDKWESEAGSYAPLVPKIRDLMKLHDEVYLLLANAQKPGRPRNGFEKKSTPLPFTGITSPWKVSTAFVYPVLASLRILLNANDAWRTRLSSSLRLAPRSWMPCSRSTTNSARASLTRRGGRPGVGERLLRKRELDSRRKC
jgi:hypothetical protein